MPSLKKSATENANQDTKDLVFGFIREIEKLLTDENDSIYQSPMIITHLCLMYYYLTEHFKIAGRNIKILNKDRSIIQLQREASAHHTEYQQTHDTAYGHINIYGTTNSLFVWKLKMMNFSQDRELEYTQIGIQSNKEDAFISGALNSRDGNYAINALGDRYPQSLNLFSDFPRAAYIETGDVVTMILNEQERTLRFYVTDEHNTVKPLPTRGVQYAEGTEPRDITFHNIRFRDTEYNTIHYNLAIRLDRDEDSIKLIHFSQTKLPTIRSNMYQRISGLVNRGSLEIYDQMFATGRHRDKQISFMFCVMCIFALCKQIACKTT